MKTILVPTDFSKCANNALTYAFELAKRSGADIHLLHVVFPTEGVDNNFLASVWIDDYLENRRRHLDVMVRRFLKNESFRGIPVKIEVEIGFPATSTQEVANKINADLIVMGTTGATGLRGAVLGSTASTLISKTKRPVLAVPVKSSYHHTAKFAFATDFRLNLNKKTLDLLNELLHLHHATLDMVHVFTKMGGQADKTQETTVSKKLNGIEHRFHYLHDTDTAQAMRTYVEATDTNVLVAVAHEHSVLHSLFFQSTTKVLAQTIRVPMLVLHE